MRIPSRIRSRIPGPLDGIRLSCWQGLGRHKRHQLLLGELLSPVEELFVQGCEAGFRRHDVLSCLWIWGEEGNWRAGKSLRCFCKSISTLQVVFECSFARQKQEIMLDASARQLPMVIQKLETAIDYNTSM